MMTILATIFMILLMVLLSLRSYAKINLVERRHQLKLGSSPWRSSVVGLKAKEVLF